MKKLIKLILIVICMISIFKLSSDNKELSTNKSDGVIITMSEFFLGRHLNSLEKEMYIEKYVKLVRKSAHFFIYSILGLLVISLALEYSLDYKTIIISIIFCLLYAVSDEIHQLYVPGRSGEVRDVFIDTIGSFFGIILYFICYTKYIKFKEKKNG